MREGRWRSGRCHRNSPRHCPTARAGSAAGGGARHAKDPTGSSASIAITSIFWRHSNEKSDLKRHAHASAPLPTGSVAVDCAGSAAGKGGRRILLGASGGSTHSENGVIPPFFEQTTSRRDVKSMRRPPFAPPTRTPGGGMLPPVPMAEARPAPSPRPSALLARDRRVTVEHVTQPARSSLDPRARTSGLTRASFGDVAS